MELKTNQQNNKTNNKTQQKPQFCLPDPQGQQNLFKSRKTALADNYGRLYINVFFL